MNNEACFIHAHVRVRRVHGMTRYGVPVRCTGAAVCSLSYRVQLFAHKKYTAIRHTWHTHQS